MNVISLDSLSFAYRLDGEHRVQVLQEVHLEIARGEFVAVQGPSGSGKSTLFHILGCLLRPSTGRYLLNGLDVETASEDQLAWIRNQEIGFVFQQFHLLPHVSVLENILLPTRFPKELRPRATPRAERARALELAARLGIQDVAERRPNKISGGQQQRTAIARALMRDPQLILADEPTGSLDTKTAEEILDVFSELNRQGKTVVVITHDPEVASRCHRVLRIRDGRIVSDEVTPVGQRARAAAASAPAGEIGSARSGRQVDGRPEGTSDEETPTANDFASGLHFGTIRLILRSASEAARNIARDRVKSLLTTVGIVIGIAAVLAMITLGQFAKRRIVDGFEVLGVNKLIVRGYHNYRLKATDAPRQQFIGFNWDRDIEPLRRLFPDVAHISPVLTSWQNSVIAGGRTAEGEIRVRGVNHEYMQIANARLEKGRWFTPYHVKNRSAVCILGHEVAEQMRPPDRDMVEMLTITQDQSRAFSCRVLGVLASQKSNQEWFQPNLQVLIPYTTFQILSASRFNSTISEVALQVRSGADVELNGKAIMAFFDNKYSKSGRFSVDGESTLIAQTKRFLNIFAALLAAIAFLSLLVGGVGIHNMMLVAIAERIKQLGLFKALGATGRSIKIQVLTESTLLCAVGGVIGVVVGFAGSELLIFLASKFVTDLPFQWVVDPVALSVSTASIIAVGILSGMVPARKAEKLEVIEALRSA